MVGGAFFFSKVYQSEAADGKGKSEMMIRVFSQKREYVKVK